MAAEPDGDSLTMFTRLLRHFTLIMIVVGLLPWSSSAMQPATPATSPADQAAAAAVAYKAGDYAQAITLYQGIVAAGQADAIIYFNLGNACFEFDDLGCALLNYRRAQRDLPRDADLNRNLAITRALRVDVLSDETALPDALAAATLPVLTTGELALLVLLVWLMWGGLVAAVLGQRMRRKPLDVRLGFALVIVSLLLVTGGVLLGGRVLVETLRPAAVVTALQTTAYSGPDTGYVPLFTLYAAAEGRILEQRGDRVRLLLPDGRQGWIETTAIQPV